MTKTCPECGLSVENDPKYCPSCGAAISARTMELSDELPKTTLRDESDQVAPRGDEQEKRVFIRRKKRYGDTSQYNDHSSLDADSSSELARKVSLSLYLSITAVVLAIAAIAIAIIFVAMPSGNSAAAAEKETAAATPAPTEPPTEPPITGTYELNELQGQNRNVYSLMLRSSRIQMQEDYTGKVTLGSWELGSVKLDKETNTATFLGLEGKYTFDGKILAIDYREVTLVYKKQ